MPGYTKSSNFRFLNELKFERDQKIAQHFG